MQESIETMRTEKEQRLSLETLLAETSTRFINVHADQIDSQIEGAQRRIREFLDIDLASLWQWSDEEGGCFMLTHSLASREVCKLPDG